MPHPHLLVENSPAGYRWLRLAHSERRNALGASLARAVRDALATEPDVPVLLGSADPRVFCAGEDLTVSDAERAANRSAWRRVIGVSQGFQRIPER